MAAAATPAPDRHSRAWRVSTREWRWLLGAVLAIVAVVALYTRVLHVTNPTIAALTFLLIVCAAAVKVTVRVAIVASVTAAASFNYYFLPPTGTWHVADPQNWFALFTLLVVSVLVSRLSGHARAREQEAVARRDELARLFDLTRDILLSAEDEDPVAAIARHVRRRFRVGRVSIFRYQAGGWTEHPATDALGVELGRLDAVLARQGGTLAFDARARSYAGAAEGHGRDGRPCSLLPLRIGSAIVGVLALEAADVEVGTRDAIAGIVAIAIERQQLIDDRREAELVRRGAELRSTLLSSLSHDLRTPITAAAVAASNLEAAGLAEDERRGQLDIIRTELKRLHRLFENIMDMARIETKAITPEPEWVQVVEIVEAATRQVGRGLAGHPITVEANEDLAVEVDPRLTSAALAHLIENAAQYSPAGAAVDVHASAGDQGLRLAVRDRGPGIVPGERDRLFDRFYRGAAGRQRFGTGMGLAITKGLTAAQGGTVRAEPAPGGGACFVMVIPARSRTLAPDVLAGEGA